MTCLVKLGIISYAFHKHPSLFLASFGGSTKTRISFVRGLSDTVIGPCLGTLMPLLKQIPGLCSETKTEG